MKMGGSWSGEDKPVKKDMKDAEEGLGHPDLNDRPTEDILGECLFSRVYDLQPRYAEKITGMLLECERERIILMLDNETILEEMVSKAAEIVIEEEESEQSGTDSDDSDHLNQQQLGDALYERVAKLETELCSQITGMLLELEESAIYELLESDEKLEHAVRKARSEYLEFNTASLSSHASSHSSSAEDNQLACELYNLVQDRCPEHADRITGMLLELDENVIEKLIDNPKDLNTSVERARTALMEEGLV